MKIAIKYKKKYIYFKNKEKFMSIRAYKIKKIKIRYSDNEIIIEKTINKEPTFNLWHDTKIFEMFQEFGMDKTNQDCCGEINISKENFKIACESKKWNEKEIAILNLIKNEFDSAEISYECF